MFKFKKPIPLNVLFRFMSRFMKEHNAPEKCDDCGSDIIMPVFGDKGKVVYFVCHQCGNMMG